MAGTARHPEAVSLLGLAWPSAPVSRVTGCLSDPPLPCFFLLFQGSCSIHPSLYNENVNPNLRDSMSGFCGQDTAELADCFFDVIYFYVVFVDGNCIISYCEVHTSHILNKDLNITISGLMGNEQPAVAIGPCAPSSASRGSGVLSPAQRPASGCVEATGRRWTTIPAFCLETTAVRKVKVCDEAAPGKGRRPEQPQAAHPRLPSVPCPFAGKLRFPHSTWFISSETYFAEAQTENEGESLVFEDVGQVSHEILMPKLVKMSPECVCTGSRDGKGTGLTETCVPLREETPVAVFNGRRGHKVSVLPDDVTAPRGQATVAGRTVTPPSAVVTLRVVCTLTPQGRTQGLQTKYFVQQRASNILADAFTKSTSRNLQRRVRGHRVLRPPGPGCQGLHPGLSPACLVLSERKPMEAEQGGALSRPEAGWQSQTRGNMNVYDPGMPTLAPSSTWLQLGTVQLLQRALIVTTSRTKQDSAPPSPRAHGDLAGPPRDQTQHQESVSTCSSGPGQAAGMATWSQDGVSAVISISRDKEPCGFETGVNPRNRTSSDPWIVVVKERPRRTAAPRAQLVLRPPLQWPPDKLCKDKRIKLWWHDYQKKPKALLNLEREDGVTGWHHGLVQHRAEHQRWSLEKAVTLRSIWMLLTLEKPFVLYPECFQESSIRGITLDDFLKIWQGIDIETKMHVRFLNMETIALCH
ncbi:hypothetical protein M91_19301 [Bos mutus]|uniref:Uncharacterized protein n=1 Tax=Bos mutus TaxID=72004 RepID=L8J025_9CETA|nr:hypothetical protein M91_19301 [Bos mutus]